MKVFKSSLRQIAPLIVLCCFVCLGGATPARATDQCTPALPVGFATGCGAVINVVAVDSSGNATAFTFTLTDPAHGNNGNPFDFIGGDDSLIGIQNSSGAPLTSITLTSPNTTFGGLFRFDHDGLCLFTLFHDCFGPTGYEGPNNTFTNIIDDGHGNKTTGTVVFTTPIVNGGSTFFALEGTPASITPSVTQPVVTNAPMVATFNNTTGKIVQQTIDLTTVTNLVTPLPGAQLLSVNNTISNGAAWRQYVIGTPFATSQCFARPGNGGTDLCSLYVNSCFDATHPPSDANCPSASIAAGSGFITLKDTFDPSPKPNIPTGTTASLIDFVPSTLNPSWTPVTGAAMVNPVCTNPNGKSSSDPTPAQCDISDSLIAIEGDQTTTKGHIPKKGTLISLFDVLTPQTTVKVNGLAPTNTLWVRSPFNLEFLVNPACPPGTLTCPATPSVANNFFVPAPIAGLTFGITDLGGAPVLADAPAMPPANPSSAVPVDFNGNTVSLADGQYLVHWSSFDTVGITERNIQLTPATATQTTCPDGSPVTPVTGACYTTDVFKTQINVDTTPPTIDPITINPSSPVFGQQVIATFTCHDVPSGIKPTGGCVGGLGGPGDSPSPVNADSSGGTHTFKVTAVDLAGNTTISSLSYTVTGAALTITAANATRPYGAANPSFTASYSGFVNPDTPATLTGVLNCTTTATTTSSVGTYPITCSGQTSTNYSISYVAGALTVTQIAASVTPNAAGKIYGAPDPAFTGTLSGFLSSDGVTASYARTAGETVAGSPYTISATLSPSAVLGNYTITYNTANFTITPAPASVTPNAAGKTYGTADATLTGTLAGFLLSDNVTAAYTRTAGETVAGSPYTISATLNPAGVLGNYTITSNTAVFTINKALASVTPNAAGKIYGQPDPTLTGTTTGFLAADNVTAAYARTAGETAGGVYRISATLNPAGVLGNYTITSNTAVFTINKALASVTPNAAGKIYGQPDPTLTGSLSGFLASDGVTATYTRTAGQTVGTYIISATLNPPGVLGNYTITSNTAVFTINKALASVTPNAASKIFGQPDPAPLTTGTLTGFLPADGVTATYTRTPGETVGTYTISATLNPAGVLGNYNITYNTAIFTITSPIASVSPSRVDFVNVRVGTTAHQTVTLKNVGNATMNITSVGISFSGDNDEFGASQCSSSALLAGASCTITVSYRADRDDSTTTTATLVIKDNAPGSPQLVPLSGKKQ